MTFVRSTASIGPPRLRTFVMCVCLVAATSCRYGLPGYSVTGSASVDGMPIPQGRLILSPDGGGERWQSVVQIENGKLRSDSNRPVSGGLHWVQVMAFDGIAYQDGEGKQAHGRQLFPMVHAQGQSAAPRLSRGRSHHDNGGPHNSGDISDGSRLKRRRLPTCGGHLENVPAQAASPVRRARLHFLSRFVSRARIENRRAPVGWACTA